MRDLAPKGPPGLAAIPEWVYLVALVLAVAPSTFVVWLCAGGAVYAGRARRWQLALAAPITALPLVVIEPMTAVGWSMAAYDPLGDSPSGWGLLFTLLLVVGRLLVVSLPIGVPLGLAVAAIRTPQGEMALTAEGLPGRRLSALRRADARRARREVWRVDRRATKPVPDRLREPVLGVVAGKGDLPPGWVKRKHLLLPERAAGLPRLVVGRPGQGKSVYLCREVFLAGVDHRQAVVVDCKGEPGFADEVEAAYRAGWQAYQMIRPTRGNAAEPVSSDTPTVHRWPDEPLNAWTGGPAAVANRLLSVWTFDTASLWYREVVDLALTLALHAPGPPVTSSREVLRRIQGGRLAELWKGAEEEAALVGSLSKDKLDDVAIRLGNLLSKLGGLLDGPKAIGTSDLSILSLPTMAQEHHAASILRVALADLAHYVVQRKPASRHLLVVVDEFSAVVGARDHAVHLAERGRSALAATVLAVQSARGLGDDDDADRLIGSAGFLVLFGTAEPERILKLAGTIQVGRESATLHDDGRASRTYAEASEYRVDANDVRALEPGYAYVLASGRAQRVKVLRPPAGGGPRPSGAAAGNPAPSDGPGRAVDGRVVPPALEPRQGRARFARGFASLDPARSQMARRDRPPQVGPGSPPDDRTPGEA